MCGGDFMSKNPEEAIDFLSYVAEVSRGWDEPNARKMGRMKSQPNAKGGMYVLNEDIDMKAKIAAMTRRLEELEMKKVQKVQAISETPVQAMPCSICQSYEHLVEECPTIPIVREMFGGVSYKQMRNHPNFSWKPKPPQYTQPARAPQQALNLEQAIANLSKGIHEVEAQEGESSNVREVKAVITLRSGKEVDQPTSKPKHDEESCKSLVKYKDPGCPTISMSIGGTCVEKTLLDLGASVNLLPYSIYKQLGLGELKPTSITLSLADRSVKIPRGMIKDVLVQVDKFYYLVDFVVDYYSKSAIL
ncbi:hypothetical protein CK203_016570 [Vitis vinifera]|uniref:Retrotransposon gag domain-containing protein n=1 Tax=Vitis vinifera TaxID=29760 RepID=A0A438J1E9_VITVI|nr:hypothetical protein CK203_016570 [Vitis vinifera]